MTKLNKKLLLGLLFTFFGIVSAYATDFETFTTTGGIATFISSVNASNPAYDVLSVTVGSTSVSTGQGSTYLVCVDTTNYAESVGGDHPASLTAFATSDLLFVPLLFKSSGAVTNGSSTDLTTTYDFGRPVWGGGIAGRTIRNGLTCFPIGESASTQRHWFSIEYGPASRGR